jgi:segregation and condensation protein A
MDYRVELDVYNGPLDLLLYLIKRDELDIYDIPIAKITDSYMEYLRTLEDLAARRTVQEPSEPTSDSESQTSDLKSAVPPPRFLMDINLAGDFLVMAATLMEIKSALLLPKPPPDPTAGPSAAQELADPRYELVQKLLEYKRFKDSAMALEQQQAMHQHRFPRYPAALPGQENEPPPIDLEEVQIWDLMEAFNRLLKETTVRAPRFHEVTYDDTPIDLHAADIEDRLNREGRLNFRQLLLGRKSRSEMIGVFLALLELIREKKILVEQPDDGALNELDIIPAPEEHRRTYQNASLHLATETETSSTEPAPSSAEDES